MSSEKSSEAPLFSKVLIANRGEIACRVIRACRARGIRTVAVFSEADRDAVHVRLADEAFCIGPPPSRESYLVGDRIRILEVAKRCGAEAIHSGYGFLSENADFRDAVGETDITFIGPPASAMRLMGSKTLARRTMIDAGVPVVPGTADPLEDADELRSLADDMGFPVMLKASAGGGGKGMRIVEKKGDLDKAWEAARREALSSFGDDTVYLEKAIVAPSCHKTDYRTLGRCPSGRRGLDRERSRLSRGPNELARGRSRGLERRSGRLRSCRERRGASVSRHVDAGAGLAAGSGSWTAPSGVVLRRPGVRPRRRPPGAKRPPGRARRGSGRGWRGDGRRAGRAWR